MQTHRLSYDEKISINEKKIFKLEEERDRHKKNIKVLEKEIDKLNKQIDSIINKNPQRSRG